MTFSNAIGLLIGNVLVGVVRDLANGAFPTTFGVAAGIALVLLVVFIAGFPPDENHRPSKYRGLEIDAHLRADFLRQNA